MVYPLLVGAQSATVLSGGTINGAAQAAEVLRLQALTTHDPSRLDVERVLTGMHYEDSPVTGTSATVFRLTDCP